MVIPNVPCKKRRNDLKTSTRPNSKRNLNMQNSQKSFLKHLKYLEASYVSTFLFQLSQPAVFFILLPALTSSFSEDAFLLLVALPFDFRCYNDPLSSTL